MTTERDIRKLFTLVLFSLLTLACAGKHDNPKTINQVDFSKVAIKDDFWTPKLNNNASGTLPVCIEQCEVKTGRIQNIITAAKMEGPHTDCCWDDSDVYKVIEGIAYNIVNTPDAMLEAKADEWIDIIATAQQDDGYIGTYYTYVKPEERWNDMNGCEMYCAGHLIEAGIAYYKATGKRKLLDVGKKMADHMLTMFGPDKRHWVAGHQEVELALVKLFELTKDRNYLDFAYWLLEERGHGYGRSNVKEDKGWPFPLYQVQDQAPVRDLQTIHGHSVRAMYQFCGMSDIMSYMPETGYMDALDRLWNDITGTRMYVTGGIGAAYKAEGFADQYELPNYEAYCETCASVGMAFWNHRMNEWKGDSKFADIVEKEIYNGIISGVSLDGTKFFYTNPLASRGDHHRFTWHKCPCCPTNIARFIPSIGSYIYATSDDAIWVNQYIGNEAEFEVGRRNVKVRIETDYPWEGVVTLTLMSAYKGQLRMRIPLWCEKYAVQVNGKEVEPEIKQGYAVLPGKWKAGDSVTLTMDMPVRLVAADPRVKADEGQRAIQRGPMVYCVESVDNDIDFESISIDENTTFKTTFKEDLLGGVATITAGTGDNRLLLIPYYSWDNREAGEMKVWIPLTR